MKMILCEMKNKRSFNILFLKIVIALSLTSLTHFRHHSTSISNPFSYSSSNSLSPWFPCFPGLSANFTYVIAFLHTSSLFSAYVIIKTLFLYQRTHTPSLLHSHTQHIDIYIDIDTDKYKYLHLNAHNEHTKTH